MSQFDQDGLYACCLNIINRDPFILKGFLDEQYYMVALSKIIKSERLYPEWILKMFCYVYNFKNKIYIGEIDTLFTFSDLSIVYHHLLVAEPSALSWHQLQIGFLFSA